VLGAAALPAYSGLVKAKPAVLGAVFFNSSS
jgi:hypothetical protein